VFERVVGLALRRPWVTLAVAVVLAVGGAVGALQLQTEAGAETLVDEDSEEFQAYDRFREDFGDDPVVVLARQDVRQSVLTQDLQSLLELETCLAGGTDLGEALPQPAGEPLPEVCNEIAELAPARLLFGPASFLFQSVAQIEQVLQGQTAAAQRAAQQASRQASRSAARSGASAAEQEKAGAEAANAVLGQFQGTLLQLALQFDITRQPSLTDTEFISRVVFDPAQEAGTPKERLTYLFPNRDASLVTVRLRPDLSDDERARAIELFQRAATDERFALSQGDYVVSGVPALVSGLAEELSSELFVLLGVAVAVMALVLLLVVSRPLRLLPLALALSAAAITFGVLSLLGGSLTMASIAVMPVLIGLAVDYAIQFQARFNEARGEGAAPARAATLAAGRGGPVIGAACLATAAGFATLVLSPIPMVRTFGLLLVLGTGLAFALAATAGFAALALSAWRGSPKPRPPAPEAAVPRAKWPRFRADAGERIRAGGERAVAVAIGQPGRVLGAAVLLAVCGWVAAFKTEVISDVRDLAPESLPALADIDVLQDETGVAGEVDVVVRSENLTDPATIAWMTDFQSRVLERYGYSGSNPTCDSAEVCPLFSLTDLFSGSQGVQSQQRAEALLETIPPYLSEAVITRDAETGAIGDTANLPFGVRVGPLDERQELIDGIRAEIDAEGGPPSGTEAELAGLVVVLAAANSELEASAYWLPFVGLAVVALVLLAVFRSPRRALVPLLPVVLASGWSSLVVAAMDVPLNPMSAALGALVIAIATEFSVLLSSRYESERAAGLSVGEALRVTYARTGSAVLASGVTAIAGFAVLTATDIRMLRDFGIVTVADLAVALIGVLLVLPAALVWAEEGFRLPGARRRAAAHARPPRPAPAEPGTG
jgi:uncharacterized protein